MLWTLVQVQGIISAGDTKMLGSEYILKVKTTGSVGVRQK